MECRYCAFLAGLTAADEEEAYVRRHRWPMRGERLWWRGWSWCLEKVTTAAAVGLLREAEIAEWLSLTET
jgi:hypothetical protein